MFKSSKVPSVSFNPDKKIEDKVSQDFVTHNMPDSQRFSGQTFGGGDTIKSNKKINNSQVASHHKMGVLIIGGGLVLIGALFYFGYSYLIAPYVQKTPEVNINKIIVEDSTTTKPKVEETVVPAEIIPVSNPVITTSTSETASSTEIILPEETPVIVTSGTVSMVDSDADGLTDNEEKIIGTDPNKADTDNDGYLDLAELKSGYDPLVPGKKTSDSSVMLNYQVDSKMSVVYPKNWEVTKSETNNTVVLSDTDKAFIQVVYQDNSEKTVPQVWFAEQFVGLNPGEAVSGDSWQGFYSQDGLSAYIFNKDLSKVYSFSCSPLTSDTSSVTLFHLMIKTLIVK